MSETPENPPLLLGPDGQPVQTEHPNAAGGSNTHFPHAEPPAAPPRPVKFERDSPELVAARGHFWRMLGLVRAEIAEASSAKEACSREPKPLAEFLVALKQIERDLKTLHATAYANTLAERYDAVQPLILDAYQVARQAGIKLPSGMPS